MNERCRLEESGSQHLSQGDKEKSFVCFRYEYSKEEYKGANTHAYNKKSDMSEVNSQEKIAEKFKEIKEEQVDHSI